MTQREAAASAEQESEGRPVAVQLCSAMPVVAVAFVALALAADGAPEDKKAGDKKAGDEPPDAYRHRRIGASRVARVMAWS